MRALCQNNSSPWFPAAVKQRLPRKSLATSWNFSGEVLTTASGAVRTRAYRRSTAKTRHCRVHDSGWDPNVSLGRKSTPGSRRDPSPAIQGNLSDDQPSRATAWVLGACEPLAANDFQTPLRITPRDAQVERQSNHWALTCAPFALTTLEFLK